MVMASKCKKRDKDRSGKQKKFHHANGGNRKGQ